MLEIDIDIRWFIAFGRLMKRSNKQIDTRRVDCGDTEDIADGRIGG